MPEWLDSGTGSGAQSGRLPIDKARSELRILMRTCRGNPFLLRHLRQAMLQINERGLDLTIDEFKNTVKEAKTLVLGHELLKAAQNGSADAVQRLVTEGAPVNFQDPRTGATALHYIAAYSARPAFRVLNSSGQCDYLIRDNKGRRAWELANSADDFAMTRLLFHKARKQALRQGVPFHRREPVHP